MDKLTTRDMDYLFMDRNTSYLAEPFEIMKGIKPYSVDEHFGDIRKSIIIKIENPSYEEFRDRYLEFDEAPEEEIRAEYDYEYPSKFTFYELYYIEQKNGNRFLMKEGGSGMIAYQIDHESNVFIESRAGFKTVLEKLEACIEQHIKLIKDGSYEKEIIDQMPYYMKTGTINRAIVWKVLNDKPLDSDYAEFDFPDRKRFIKKAEASDLSKTTERLEEMSAALFFKCCYAGYTKNNYDVKNKTPKEAYERFADGRDDGLTKIDEESTEAFKNWYEDKTRFGGHPWEVCRGGNSTHVSLYIHKDKEGYYFVVDGRAESRFVEAINFYMAISDMKLPVVLNDSNLLLTRLKGEENIGIVPRGVIPRYCESRFPNEEIFTFMNIYQDEEAIVPYVKWQKVAMPELESL